MPEGKQGGWNKNEEPNKKVPKRSGDVVIDEDEFEIVDGEEIPKAEYERRLEEFKVKMQSAVDNYGHTFEQLTGGIPFRIKVTTSGGFCVDLERHVVMVDASWGFKRGFNEYHFMFGLFHEFVAHLRDKLEDMKETAERLRKDNKPYDRKETQYYKQAKHHFAFARKWGAVIDKKWRAAFPGDEKINERLSGKRKRRECGIKEEITPSEEAAYGVAFMFDNIYDDVAGNSAIGAQNELYKPGSRGDQEVRELYRNALFPREELEDGTLEPVANYEKLPRHMQFLYYCLRRRQVPDEDVIVSPEVQEMLHKDIKVAGERTSVFELTKQLLVQRGRPIPKARQRHTMLNQYVFPAFEELFKKDLDEWDPKKPVPPSKGKGKKGKGGSVDPFALPHENHNENHIDQMDEDDEENIIDNEEKDFAKKEADKNKPKLNDEEKADEAKKSADEEWAKRNGLTMNQLKKYNAIKAIIAPHIETLSQVWDEIIAQARIRYLREIRTRQQIGDDIDTQEVIEQFAHIRRGDVERARIYERSVPVEMREPRPEKIRIRLVGDVSGSMVGEGIQRLKEIVTLLSLSIQQFNIRLDITREETGLTLEVEVQHREFDDETTEIKPLTSELEKSGKDEMAETVRSVVAMKDKGGTDEVKALKAAFLDIKRDTHGWADLKSGHTREIVVLTSDGGFGKPKIARQYVDELTKRGVLVYGLLTSQFDQEVDGKKQKREKRPKGMPRHKWEKIVDVKQVGDAGRFAEVFIDGRPFPLGTIVKTHADVAPALVTFLANTFKQFNM